MKRYIRSNISDNLDWVDSLIVTDYYDDFIRENIKNPDFLAWGKEHARYGEVEELWRELRTKHHLQDIHEIPIEDAVSIVRDGIRACTHEGWFRGGDRNRKTVLVDQILSRPDVLNAGLNIAYDNYKWDCKGKQVSPMSFNEWLYTPQIMYRGEVGKVVEPFDVFYSYSPDPRVASKFGNYLDGTVHRIKIRPIDTLGSYQTNGEMEFLVPKEYYKKSFK